MKTITTFILSVILIWPQTKAISQTTAVIDSLTAIVAQIENEGENKTRILNDVAQKILLTNPQRSVDIAKKALSLSENDDLEKTEALLNMANGYFYLADYAKALDYYNRALALLSRLNESSSGKTKQSYEKKIIALYNNIGAVYQFTSDNAKAIDSYKAALSLASKINDTTSLASIYSCIGSFNFQISNYDSALFYYYKSLGFTHKTKNRTNIASLQLNIGNIHFRQGNYQKAIILYEKALVIYRELNQQINISTALLDIGLVNIELNNHAEAEKYLMEALKIKRGTGDKMGIAVILNNLGINSLKQGNYSSAMPFFEQSLKLKKEINDKNGIGNTLNQMGLLYFKQGNTEKSLLYFNEAKAIALETNNKNLLKDIYENLTAMYVSKSNFKKAYEYQKLFMETNDSITNEKTNKLINELNIKYETEKKKKEQEIMELKLSNQQKEIKKQKKIKYMLMAIVLATIVLAVLVYYIIRLRLNDLKRKNQLKNQEHIIRKKELEIAKSNEEKANIELAYRQKEIKAKTVALIKMSEKVNGVLSKIKEIEPHISAEGKNMYQSILFENKHLNIDKNWNDFNKYFLTGNPGFYRDLFKLHPELTKAETKLCAFICAGMNTNEIAALTFQSINSINVSKSRLKKKLGTDDIVGHLKRFGAPGANIPTEKTGQ